MQSPNEFGADDSGAENSTQMAPNSAESGRSEGPSVFSLLTATDSGGRTVGDIQHEYGLDSRGIATILLGILKMSGTGGFPAAIDILCGAYLTARENVEPASQQTATESGESGAIDARIPEYPNGD